ncbi:short-chain fatty acid transporter [Natranaerofaba carboxydovora]|uniref:short-chain fatty acid transporter n=1 Tax=Natranaerofaba carboxydovora TaxID=2742683 RepID=UPI001F130D7A|nr:TIGR00366 family protein [Natranaerofaba carboxydovora]UMZ74231.1 Putative short-chain fatty acid transporter [Natranaerofaba carboxydovora]
MKYLGELFADKFSRWLPESLVFAFILTIIIAVTAVLLTPTGPGELIEIWYGGFWEMLEFAMQMALIITLGYAIGLSRPISNFFDFLANKINNPSMAYVAISVVSLILVTINWGLAPIGAVFAVEVCRRVKGIDIRLACAAVYTALIPWHGGLSSSAALKMNTEGNQFIEQGIVEDVIPISATLGSTLNISLIIASFIIIPTIIFILAPQKVDKNFDAALVIQEREEAVEVKESSINEEEFQKFQISAKNEKTPSDILNESWILNVIIASIGFVFLIFYFSEAGIDGLELNSANFTLLMVGLILHKTPIQYLYAVRQAVRGIGDLIIQFPFYAGIMGIFMFSGLSELVVEFFVNISTEFTFPLFSFISAAIVNVFIPSGGGQWVAQAPVLLPAAESLGVSLERVIIAFGYGDALTNLINPFWTLAIIPIISRVIDIKARDFMGYAVLIAIIFFFINSALILFVP